MRHREKSQRVDIDEYFHGFEDFTESLATLPSQPPALSPKSQAVKTMLMGNPDQASPVLAPYQYQSAILSQPKTLSPFELEAAHRAVTSIKSQLIGDFAPGVQAQIFPPTPAASASQDGINALVAVAAQTSLPPQRSSATQGTERIWRGSLVAILGTTITALLVYAYGNNHLQPYLAQAQTLGRLSLVQANHLSRLSWQQVRLALPKPPVIASLNRTAEQAAMAQSMKFAYTAAELTQSAMTPDDWQQVLLFWRRAIDELQPIQAGTDLFPQAQERRQRYQDNFAYAQGELEMAPFRIAVNAAELASKMADSATTAEEWADIAAKWQEALSNMEAVSTKSSRYEIAQVKRAEYATKFAYAQNRHLDLQARSLR